MKRTILFSGTKTQAAARLAFKWICEEGGTFIMPNRTALLQAIGVKVDPRLKINGTFDRAREKYLKKEKPVSIGVSDKNDYMVIGPRVAITSPADGILTALEAQMNAKGYHEYMLELMVCIQLPNSIHDWASYYRPEADPRGFIPDGWQKLLDESLETVEVPSDIQEILAEAAKDAAGETTGRFHIDMVDSLKYDIDVNWDYWKVIKRDELMRASSDAGITLADANDLRSWYEMKARGSAPRPTSRIVDYHFLH